MSVTLLAASAASSNWATASSMNARRRDVTVTECAISVGDIVREDWSGFPGTVVEIDDAEAIVEYPNGGRRLRSRLGCLVPVSLGPRAPTVRKRKGANEMAAIDRYPMWDVELRTNGFGEASGFLYWDNAVKPD